MYNILIKYMSVLYFCVCITFTIFFSDCQTFDHIPDLWTLCLYSYSLSVHFATRHQKTYLLKSTSFKCIWNDL